MGAFGGKWRNTTVVFFNRVNLRRVQNVQTQNFYGTHEFKGHDNTRNGKTSNLSTKNSWAFGAEFFHDTPPTFNENFFAETFIPKVELQTVFTVPKSPPINFPQTANSWRTFTGKTGLHHCFWQKCHDFSKINRRAGLQHQSKQFWKIHDFKHFSNSSKPGCFSAVPRKWLIKWLIAVK